MAENNVRVLRVNRISAANLLMLGMAKIRVSSLKNEWN